jgi:DNA-binding CsgD family transcriptional regulator
MKLNYHDSSGLTHREREVLTLIGEGQTTKEIAIQLKISQETIGNHRKSICRKLDAHSTAKLAAYGATLSIMGKPLVRPVRLEEV